MVRSLSNFCAVALTIALSFNAVPGGLAGPACARRYKNTEDCISKCSSGWGWPGKAMGTDPWGNVMAPADSQSASAMIAEACGVTSTAAAALAPSSSNISSPNNVAQTSSILLPASAISVSTRPSASSSIQISLAALSSTTVSRSSVMPTVTVSFPRSSSSARIMTSIRTSSQTKPTSSSTSVSVTVGTPTTAPSSSSTVSTSSKSTSTPTIVSGSTGSTSSSDINAYLSGHNSVRSQHGASPLTWNQELADKAQQWANGCVFQHSGGSLGPYGENLAAGTGSSYGIAAAINSWAVEVSQYDPNNPQPSHFTQMVWKGTTQVGCAVQTCSGIFPSSYGPAQYYVCEYSPAGNVIGQFPQNVQV